MKHGIHLLLIALLFMIAITTACSDQTSSPTATPAQQVTATAQAQTTTATPEPEDNLLTPVGTYPIVNETVTLDMFMPQPVHIIDYDTNDFTKYLEELMGIDLEFIVAPNDAATEKINLLMTSGTYPSIFYRAIPGTGKFGVDEGILLDLTDLIATQMPNLSLEMEKAPEFLSQMKSSDGKIYALPYLNECYHCTIPWKMWVNTMWLDTMGVETPKTTEEFYNICKQYQALNPDGIPLGGSSALSMGDPTVFLTNAFTYYAGDAYGVRVKDGMVETVMTTEEYKQALQFINNLYKEKLLDEGIFTMNRDQAKALAASDGEPILFIAAMYSGGFADAAGMPDLYRHYYAVDPLMGPGGAQFAPYLPSAVSGQYVITDVCEIPEVAARFADYFYSIEGYVSGCYGIEGIGWKYSEPGTIGLNGKPAVYENLIPWDTTTPQNTTWQNMSLIYATAEFRGSAAADPTVDIFTPAGLEKLLYDVTRDNYQPYVKDEYQTVPALQLLTEESQQIQTITVEVQNFITQSKVDFITGAKDIDTDWDAYVEALDNIGMQTLIDTFQTAYDRQYK